MSALYQETVSRHAAGVLLLLAFFFSLCIAWKWS